MTRKILHDLGFFGHYLHIHAGGRGGKQFILAALHKSDGRLLQRDLLEQARISPAALSEVLAKLEGEGLIVRKPFEHDRRQLLIQLTEKGEGYAEHMCQQRDEFERTALSCLAPEEQDQLESLLQRLKQHWESLQEGEASA